MRFLVPIFVVVVAASTTTNKRSAINRDNLPDVLWPTDRPILYRFTSNFSYDDRGAMREAMERIALRTCLSFKDVSNQSEVQSNESTMVFHNTDCAVEIDGIVPLNSIPLHVSLENAECKMSNNSVNDLFLLSALGMILTHLRPDRDDYIYVHEEAILPNNVKQFTKKDDFQYSTYGVPYDFDSLLHIRSDYSQKTKGIPAMVAKDPLHQPGMGIHYGFPSHSDYLTLNRLYRCFDRCNQSEVKCENGGFLNPNHCTSCICPRGFFGTLCNGMDSLCGGYEQSTTSWRRLSVDWSSVDERRICYWFLTAPIGRKIEIQLENIVPEDPQCPYTPLTWLEVRLGNFVLGGYKFFCNGHIPNHTLISEGNLAVLSLNKNVNVSIEFELLFRNIEANSRNVGSTFTISLLLMFPFVAVTTI